MKNDDLIILKSNIAGSGHKYLLKLNRRRKRLEIYEKTAAERLKEYHSIRGDFDVSPYVMFEKKHEYACIFGSEETPTPVGIFHVEDKSSGEYISGYCKGYDKVKFFGYLIIFEDYFVHSDFYSADVKEKDVRAGTVRSISGGDAGTSGCVRVPQSGIDWLTENIEIGTIAIFE